MATRTATLPPDKLSDKVVRQQLSRILASKTFPQVDRLKRFINFIVGETVGGRGGDLKEYVIGVQVFGKEAVLRSRAPIRSSASRRGGCARGWPATTATKATATSSIVDLPKGGYAPVFRPREEAPRPKRSLTAALVGRNTVAVLPLRRRQRRRQPRLLLPRPARRNRARADVDQGRCACSPRAPTAAADEPHRQRAVDAALVITGGVRSARDRVRVTTHLVDGASGFYLWSESADVIWPIRLAGQEAIAQAVVDKLAPEVYRGPARRQHAGNRDNLAARNLYLQGRYHLNQRTEEGLHKAVDFFEKAIVEDAQFCAGAQRAGRRLRPAGALRRARPGRRVGQGGVERGVGGDARRPFGRGAHLAGARAGDAGLGLGPAPSASSSAPFS